VLLKLVQHLGLILVPAGVMQRNDNQRKVLVVVKHLSEARQHRMVRYMGTKNNGSPLINTHPLWHNLALANPHAAQSVVMLLAIPDVNA